MLSADAGAWGRLGHEVAGALCERHLAEPARTRVRDLLGRESLAEASHWADRMRGNPAPFWQEEAGPYHYVTVPPGRDYAAVGPPPQGDAVTALAMFADELGDPQTSRERQQLALRFAIHIAQDLQQPLHVGNGGDRGGNDIAVRVHGEPSNLHRVWDTQIIESAGLRRGEWLRRLEHRGLLRTPEAGDDDPLHWIAESAALRDSLYPPRRNYDTAALRAALPTAEQRLALAGIRCAAWLNANLPADAVIEAGRAPQPRSWWQRLFRR